MRKLFLVLIFLLIVIICKAQTMIAQPFPFFYQLYSNEITYIHQDHEGYIWIGSTDGLYRYDGHRIVSFRNNYISPTLLTGNHISCIIDQGQHVWIGGNGGITVFDKRFCTFTKLTNRNASKSNISDLVNDCDGTVWASSGNNIFHYHSDGTLLGTYQINASRDCYINHFYVDRQQRLWVLAYGGLFVYDRKQDKFRKYPKIGSMDSPFVMYQDHGGRLWIGTWGDGLWLFNPEKKGADCFKKISVKISGTDEEDNIAFSIAQDDVMGYLWTLSYKELHALKIEGDKLVPVDISNVLDPHMMFTQIVKDREGNFWLGSYDMGYNIFFNRSGIENYSMRQLKDRLGWDANLVNLVSDGDVVWTSQDRYGLLLYDKANNELADQSKPLGEISLIRKSTHGGLWLSCRSERKIVKAVRHGMSVEYPYTLQLDKFVSNPGIVRDMAEDAEGTLWILTDGNLFAKKQNATGIASAGAGMPIFTAMACDSHSKLWCFSLNKLYKLSLHQNSILTEATMTIDSLGNGESITRCCIDREGKLWTATTSGRILLSDTKKKSFKDLHISDIIADGPVLSIVSSGKNVWVVTNKAIVMSNSNGKVLRTWHANEGNILVKEFRQNAVCADGNGGIMAGGHGGFVHITPSGIQAKGAKDIQFTITDVTSNGKSLLFSINDSHNTPKTITILPDERNIRIHFSALRYAPGTATAVSYKLVGVDNDWVTLNDNSCTAFYNQLPDGKHKFLIRYLQSDGNWSNVIAAATIIQKPVFYKSSIAYIIYLLLLAAIIALCIKKRERIAALFHKLSTMQKMYKGKIRLSVLERNEEKVADGDKEFMEKVLSTIREHVSDSNFGVDELATAMSMSRSTLYRRVSNDTGVTPADVIRRVQLERACELLESAKVNISEIAYAVGFSNPKYFTKCFKDEFGVTPSEYQRKHKNISGDTNKG